MDYSIRFYTLHLRWFIVHTRGVTDYNFQLRCTSVPEDYFISAKTVQTPDEIQHFAVFHMGLMVYDGVCLWVSIIKIPFMTIKM